MSRSWKDGALDGPRSPKYTRSKFKYKEPEVSEIHEVYVIINEWSPEDSSEDMSEIVHGQFYLTKDEAWEDLYTNAKVFGVEIDRQDTSFNVPERHLQGLVRDNYYIQELSR